MVTHNSKSSKLVNSFFSDVLFSLLQMSQQKILINYLTRNNANYFSNQIVKKKILCFNTPLYIVFIVILKKNYLWSLYSK